MPSEPLKIDANDLLVWLEALSERPDVQRVPEIRDTISTAIAGIREMILCGVADQSRVDMLFGRIVDAIGERQRTNLC